MLKQKLEFLKRTKRNLKSCFILLAFTLLCSMGVVQGGEILDQLPEVQLARAIVITAELEELSAEELAAICDAQAGNAQDVENLWFDEHGTSRSLVEVREILLEISCLLERSLPVFSLDDEGNAHTEALFELVSGNAITATDGQVIDGGRHAIRTAVAFPVAVTFVLELFLGNAFGIPTPLLGDTPCEELSAHVFSGKTLELRWAAFLVLEIDLLTHLVDGNPQAICSSQRDEPLDSLLEQSRRGDLEAALNLTFLWNQAVKSAFEQPDDSVIKRELDETLLLFIKHFGEPLVTLAATVSLISLMAGQSL